MLRGRCTLCSSIVKTQFARVASFHSRGTQKLLLARPQYFRRQRIHYAERGCEFGMAPYEECDSTCCNKHERRRGYLCLLLLLSMCGKLNISALIEAIFLRARGKTVVPAKCAREFRTEGTQSRKHGTVSANIFYRPAIRANRAAECAEIVFITWSLGQSWMHVCARMPCTCSARCTRLQVRARTQITYAYITHSQFTSRSSVPLIPNQRTYARAAPERVLNV